MEAISGKSVSSWIVLIIAVLMSMGLGSTSTTENVMTTRITEIQTVTDSPLSSTPLTTSAITDGETATSTSIRMTEICTKTMTTSAMDMTTSITDSSPTSSSSFSPSSSSSSSSSLNTHSTTELVSAGDVSTSAVSLPPAITNGITTTPTSVAPAIPTTVMNMTETSTVERTTSATDGTTNITTTATTTTTTSSSSSMSNTHSATELTSAGDISTSAVSSPYGITTALTSVASGIPTTAMNTTETFTVERTASATDRTTNMTDPSSLTNTTTRTSSSWSSSSMSNTLSATELMSTAESSTPPVSTSALVTSEDPATSISTESNSEPGSTEPTIPTTAMTTKAKVGPVPEPSYPEIEDDPHKIYHFEFAVVESSTGECYSTDLTSNECENFTVMITDELEKIYEENEAFVSVEVELRAGSVIVSHNVSYYYNKMSEEERMASAEDIYDQTLGEAVADGKLGNYTVSNNCSACRPPEETSSICDLEPGKIGCSSYSDPVCRKNYWVCESVCNTAYCNSNGICWQDDLSSQPVCSCDWNKDHWYWGYRCQHFVDQMYLIIGCSCGGAVLIVFLVSVIAYVYVRKTSYKKAPSSENNDDVINAFQNRGYDHGEAIFPPLDDTDDSDILQRRRPYSYIYTNTDDIESGSSFKQNQNGSTTNNQRNSRIEVVEDGAKRLSLVLKSNGGPHDRHPDFWGNLNDQPAEHIKLEPVLDHIDVNESYKIQRPRISANYSYSNTSATPNVYHGIDSPRHSQYLPDPDYAQR